MNQNRNRFGMATLAAAGVVFLGACSDAAGPMDSPRPTFAAGETSTYPTIAYPVAGHIRVCVEAGPPTSLEVTEAAPAAATIIDPANINTLQCMFVAENLLGAATDVTVDMMPGYGYTSAHIWNLGEGFTTPITLPVTRSLSGSTGYTIKLSTEDIPVQDGCTLTQGYWKTHSILGPAGPPNDTWNDVGGPNAPFFLSGKTWFQAFWTPPAGNAYYNLAHQYMAAVLNGHNGADAPAAVTAAISAATVLFNTYTPAQVAAWKGQQGARPQFISLAGTLGSYNEGLTGPGHCDDGNDES